MKVANLLNKEKLERKSHKKMWLFFRSNLFASQTNSFKRGTHI